MIINSKIIENNYTSDNYPQKDGWLKGAKFTKLTIGDSVTSIGNNAFRDCTSLTSITIPDSVTNIGAYAFSYCSSLTSVTIGNGVTSIGNYAFFDCTSLTSVTIGNGVTSIGDCAFQYCSSLTSITIPDGVKTIGSSAFEFCTSLTSVTIGNGVTNIGDSVCYGCNKLKTVYCKSTTPPSLLDPMLIEMGIKTYVPIDSVDAYKTATYWSDFPDHIIGCVFEDENLVSGENISTINGMNIIGDYDFKLVSKSDDGSVYVDGNFYCSDNFEVNTNSECYATAFYETSDENLKDFTDDITVDFNKLKEIRKSYFTWKDGDQNLHIGTSAQDIQKVYPELVSKDNEGNLTVDYAKLSIIALSAIDKLDERLSRIENILNKEE